MGFKKYFFIVILIYPTIFANGQKYLKGTVYEKSNNPHAGQLIPLPGATMIWKGTTNGTTTDANGKFRLQRPKEEGPHFLIVSYVGYKSDTLRVPEQETTLNVLLKPSIELPEVEVKARKEYEHIDRMNPVKTEIITTSGLQRLACCNLSESFENSGTVDVTYTDAVTGAKQIQMLGLAGIYSQMLNENLPMMRGLSAPFGLLYIPGTWMESIQISKGTASVINGYESITGQINVELKKPMKNEKFLLNTYINDFGKGEINILASQKLSPRLTAMTLIHTESQALKNDINGDSFLDIPLNRQLNFHQRFNYEEEGKFCNQYGITALLEDKTGGQMSFNPKNGRNSTEYYGVGINTRKYELSAKHGISFPEKLSSIGLQAAGTLYSLDSYFGLNTYNAIQKSFYSNLIYQSLIKTTSHKVSLGGSYTYDGFEEQMTVKSINTIMNSAENVFGSFVQYTYDHSAVWTVIAGFRGDYNTIYGTFLTPRLHFKYNISEHSNLRISAGKGYRTPHIVAENIGLLASSRTWVLNGKSEAEQAWNYGISYNYEIPLKNDKKIIINIDAFRTDFVNQVIVDIESNLQQVNVTNLDGKSYSNSFQANITLKVVKNLEITAVGRYNDVWQTIGGKTELKPLVAPFKGLLTLAYNTKHDKWSFDLTGRYNGSTRLPVMDANPPEYRLNNQNTAGVVLYAQVTRRFKKIDLYAGAENITDFVQKDPIISAANPFGDYFDSSLIWGPVIGRMFYAGLRFKIE